MIIAADVGATNLRVALANKRKIIKKVKVNTERCEALAIPRQIAQISKNFGKKVEAIVVASAGLINPKKGEIEPPNLPFKKIPLVEYLSKELKLPVHLINDGNASVLGEKFYGSGKKCENLAYVTFSTGIGGGIIVNNNLLLGKDGNAGEIGHTVIDEQGKLMCSCGKKGHWEAYCSGRNILNFAKLRLGKRASKIRDVYELFEKARKGEKTILKFLDEVGRLNAIGIANLINNFDPELITIGGGIALNNRKLILNPIKKYLKNYVFNRVPKIQITKLGEDITIYGCMSYFYNFLKKEN